MVPSTGTIVVTVLHGAGTDLAFIAAAHTAAVFAPALWPFTFLAYALSEAAMKLAKLVAPGDLSYMSDRILDERVERVERGGIGLSLDVARASSPEQGNDEGHRRTKARIMVETEQRRREHENLRLRGNHWQA